MPTSSSKLWLTIWYDSSSINTPKMPFALLEIPVWSVTLTEYDPVAKVWTSSKVGPSEKVKTVRSCSNERCSYKNDYCESKFEILKKKRPFLLWNWLMSPRKWRFSWRKVIFTSYSNPSSWPCPVIFSVTPALFTCAPFLPNSTMTPDGAFTITLVTKVFPLCSADGSVLPIRDNPLSGSDKNLSWATFSFGLISKQIGGRVGGSIMKWGSPWKNY